MKTETLNIEELKALADKYKKQQERCKAYHKRHPEKTNGKVKKYYKTIKEPTQKNTNKF